MEAAGGLIVIDPVNGFTHEAGGLARMHGQSELGLIDGAVGRIQAFAREHRGPAIWVRPVYRAGQCTVSDPAHPLANLCADADGFDCQWDERLIPPAGAAVVTKNERDACSSPEFLDAFESLVATCATVLMTGFLLTSCVEQTASSCQSRLRGRNSPVALAVSRSMTASRAARYQPNIGGVSDTEAALERLRLTGVAIAG